MTNLTNQMNQMKQEVINLLTKHNTRNKINLRVLNEQKIRDISLESFG